MMHWIGLVVISVWVMGCASVQQPAAKPVPPAVPMSELEPTRQQEAEIRALIEQLVFTADRAHNRPVYTPGLEDESDRLELSPEEYRERYHRCVEAFNKLSEYKGLALPIMLEHLDDKRQSVNFRNHFLGNSVGNACYWNIYFQLQDRPAGYSRYGYSRLGADGEQHVKPYWDSTPFQEAGGLVAWMEQNAGLSYTEMQIKCISWLLERERAIGAPDEESYAINILPLEIRLLERKLELGEGVQPELDRLRRVQATSRAERSKKLEAELRELEEREEKIMRRGVPVD